MLFTFLYESYLTNFRFWSRFGTEDNKIAMLREKVLRPFVQHHTFFFLFFFW